MFSYFYFCLSRILNDWLHYRLQPHQLKHLAKVIVEKFPTEITETYYTPASKGKGPGGKLHSQYYNFQTRLAAVGLINRRSKTAETQQQPQESESTSLSLDALATVKGNDWEDTLNFFDCWQKCYNERQFILSGDITTEDYIKLFPYIQQTPNGYELVRYLRYLRLKFYWVKITIFSARRWRSFKVSISYKWQIWHIKLRFFINHQEIGYYKIISNCD